jgi:DNA-binding transcriptional regulator LsrR (DeoR family)
VPKGTSDYEAVGQLAVGSFLNHLKPRVKVAISWGRSIQAMVDALEPESRPDLTFIPLMGGMTAIPSSHSGEALIRSLAEKFNAEYQILHAPTIVQSPDIKVALMREPSVASVIESARTADVAFVGIGSKGANSSRHILQSVGLDLEEISKIKRVVGVAAGEEKTEGILAALRGGLISELVTSSNCATRLLEAAESKKLGELV